MNAIFTINRNYENLDDKALEKTRERAVHHRRHRLGRALRNFNGGNELTFYFNLIFK